MQRMSFKTFLESAIGLAGFNKYIGHPEVSSLTNREEFKTLDKSYPKYGEALIRAWDGDKREFDRSSDGKIETLFNRMFTPKVLKDFSVELDLNDPETKKLVDGLMNTHKMSFSKKLMPHDDWAHVKPTRESIEEDKAYEALKERVLALNE